MRQLFFFLAVFIYGSSVYAQQAWTQKKGEGYFQVGNSLLYSTALHNGREAIDIPRPIMDYILSAYGEIGITDDLTASLTVPFVFASNGSLDADWQGFAPQKGSLRAFGNITTSLTYELYGRNSWVVSSRLGLGINSSKYDELTGLRTGFDAFIISPFILAGYGSERFFASMETGPSFLTNGYLDRYVFNAQIGKHLLKSNRLIFIFAISTSTLLGQATPAENALLDANSSFTGMYQNEQYYYAGSIKLGYDITDHWSVWTSFGGGIAKNVGQGINYFLGIGYKLKQHPDIPDS